MPAPNEREFRQAVSEVVAEIKPIIDQNAEFKSAKKFIEATGYGLVYSLQHMLQHHDDDPDGKSMIISGMSNVATHPAEKTTEFGAKVISLSDNAGFIHDPEGLSPKKIGWVHAHKAKSGATLEAYAAEFGATWTAG